MDVRGQHSEWLPCYDGWCWEFSDRFSGSIINKRLPHIFDDNRPGFVLQPEAAGEAFLCAYFRDGGTMDKKCHPPGVTSSCVPGCRMPYSVWSDGLR
uniref:Uncharacterized protein n=1 Tax=Calcidiscus leptoporus TaxID=127549 RepID=A0A7S0P0A4_9EUKA